MTIHDGSAQHEPDQRYLRWIEADLLADPRRVRRMNRWQSAHDRRSPVRSTLNWTAVAASAGVLGVDAAFLAAAVAAPSTGFMVIAVLLFYAVPIPLWWHRRPLDRRPRP